MEDTGLELLVNIYRGYIFCLSKELKFVICLNVFLVTEYNSMISLEESKAILPPEDNKSWKMWDNSTRYQVIVKFWIVQFWIVYHMERVDILTK